MHRYNCLLIVILGCLAMTSIASEDLTADNTNSLREKIKPFTSTDKKGDLEPDNTINKSPSTWSSLFSALFNFITSKSDRDGSGTRQLLKFVEGLLDMGKRWFMQRSAQSREAIGIGRMGSDAASAVITMAKGYVRTIGVADKGCIQRIMCQINREVVRDAREIGYIVGKAGSSLISYVLERSKEAPYDANYNASRRGLDGDDCEALPFGCNEVL